MHNSTTRISLVDFIKKNNFSFTSKWNKQSEAYIFNNLRYLWITIIEVLCSYKCPIFDCLFHGVFSLFKFKIHLLCTVLYTVKVWRMGPWTLRTRAALVGRHTRQQSSSLMARRLSCTSGTPRAKADFVQLSGRLYRCFPVYCFATTKPPHLP